MNTEQLVKECNAKVVHAVSIGGHVFSVAECIKVTEYYGEKVIYIGDSDHWHIVFYIETGVTDYKADDSLFDGVMNEIPVIDLYLSLKQGAEQ